MSAFEPFVPKVHPLTRQVEQDDPMELVAAPVMGDPEVMLECLVQEYAWMGWDGEQIFQLFQDPNYPALHALLGHYGEEGIRQRLDGILEQMPVLRFEAIVDEEPEPEEPELIQLGLPAKPLVRS
jgi:hypothetical protein